MVVDVLPSETSVYNYERLWFFFLIFYLIIDLGRPQEIFPIASLRIGMLVTIVLALFLFGSGRFASSICLQSKLILFFVFLLAGYIPVAANNFYAYMAFRTIFLMLPFLLSYIILVNSRSRLLATCKAYAALMVMMSVYSLSHNAVGPGGALHDENDLCLFLVTYLPLVLFVAKQEKRKFKKFLWMAGVILTTIAVVFTKSRGGFVGLSAMVAAYWWFSKKKIALLVGIVLLSGIMLVVGGDSYRKDMGTITDIKENTAMERLLSWEAGLSMFLDNPLGVGGNNFPIHFPEYQPAEIKRNMWGRVAHSLWFTLIPETGIFGILIYFLIIRMNFKDLKCLSKLDEDDFFPPLAIAVYASFAGFFAAASFISVLYYPYFWYLTVLVMSARKILATPVINHNEN